MPEVQQFKQIQGVDYRPAMAGVEAAGRTFDKAFGTVGGVMEDVTKRQDFQIDKETDENTATFQRAMESVSSLDTLNKAEGAGEFNLASMSDRFGSRIDKDAAKEQVEAARSRLRSSAISIASGVGRATAEETKDLTAGSERMFKSLIDQGATPDYAQQQSNAWVVNSAALKGELKKDRAELTTEAIKLAGVPESNEDIEDKVNAADPGVDKDSYREALQRVLRGSEEDRQASVREKTRTNEDAINKGLILVQDGGDIEAIVETIKDPKAKLEFRTRATAQINELSQLNEVQSFDVNNTTKQRSELGAQIASANSEKISIAQAELSAIPQDDSRKAAEAFGVKGMNNMESVIDVIGGEMSWTRDSQPEALIALQQRLQGKYNRNDTVALIAQAWTDTRSKEDGVGWKVGQGIDVPMMERYIESVLKNRSDRVSKQAQINKMINAENVRARQFNADSRARVENIKGTYRSQNSGRQFAKVQAGKAPIAQTTKLPESADAIAEQLGFTVRPETAKTQVPPTVKEEATEKLKEFTKPKQTGTPFSRLTPGSVNAPIGSQSTFVKQVLENRRNRSKGRKGKRFSTEEERREAIARVKASANK